MSCDMRQSLGYRPTPAGDATEKQLRDLWYATRTQADSTGERRDIEEHQSVHDRLTKYLWDRATRQVAADRAKHPKAKRNAAVGSQRSGAVDVPIVAALSG